MSLTLTWDQSERIRLRYVCSDCWSDVHTEQVGENLYRIACDTAGCTTPGIVSLQTVNWRTRMNEHYRYLAMIALKDAIPWLKQVDHSNKSVKQLLEELGYKENT